MKKGRLDNVFNEIYSYMPENASWKGADNRKGGIDNYAASGE
jgi:hypothetical protein